MAEPPYSNTWPVPPATPIRESRLRMMSLAVTPGWRRAVDPHLEGLRAALQQGLGGQHVLDLGGADPDRQRAERAVGRGVRVAAHDRHARLRQSQLRTDDVHDPLVRRSDAVQGNPELVAVLLEAADLGERDLVGEGKRAIRRGNRVVHGRQGLARATHAEAAVAQAVECLRARHLVDKVQVDAQHVGSAIGAGRDEMVVPDLVDDRARAC